MLSPGLETFVQLCFYTSERVQQTSIIYHFLTRWKIVVGRRSPGRRHNYNAASERKRKKMVKNRSQVNDSGSPQRKMPQRFSKWPLDRCGGKWQGSEGTWRNLSFVFHPSALGGKIFRLTWNKSWIAPEVKREKWVTPGSLSKTNVWGR